MQPRASRNAGDTSRTHGYGALRRRALTRFSRVLLLCAAASAAAAPGGGKGADGSQPTATLEFSADQTSYQTGDTATLRWRSTDTRFCSASGDWNGKLASEGSYQTAPLDGPKSYEIVCKASGGDVSDTLTLAVADAGTVPDGGAEPGGDPVSPALTLAASETIVGSGQTATLTWSADNAGTCSASGGWSGSRDTSGTETIGPIYGSTAYTLSCEGNGASVVETVRVDIRGQVTIEWDPPATNVDGSTLDDLAAFDVYVGSASGAYDDSVQITDTRATSHTLTLPSGTYFIAMTATNRDGRESGYSNEIERAVP